MGFIRGIVRIPVISDMMVGRWVICRCVKYEMKEWQGVMRRIASILGIITA